MSNSLFDVLQWAQKQGEVKAVDRIRVMVLPVTLKEKIQLANVKPTTICSSECLAAVRQAAALVVGKPCPV